MVASKMHSRKRPTRRPTTRTTPRPTSRRTDRKPTRVTDVTRVGSQPRRFSMEVGPDDQSPDSGQTLPTHGSYEDDSSGRDADS